MGDKQVTWWRVRHPQWTPLDELHFQNDSRVLSKTECWMALD